MVASGRGLCLRGPRTPRSRHPDCVHYAPRAAHCVHYAPSILPCEPSSLHYAPLSACTMHPSLCALLVCSLAVCTMHLSLRASRTSNCVHLVLLMQPIVCTMHPSLCALWSPHCRLGTADRCRGPPGRRGWKGSMMDLSLELLGGFSMVSDVTMASHSVPNISHTNRPGVHNACRVGLELRTSDVLRGRPRFESCPNSLAEARSGVDLGRAPNPHLVCTTEAHACRTAAVGLPSHAACHQMR